MWEKIHCTYMNQILQILENIYIAHTISIRRDDLHMYIFIGINMSELSRRHRYVLYRQVHVISDGQRRRRPYDTNHSTWKCNLCLY